MPMDHRCYPKNWKAISEYVRFFRAGGLCEGSPEYPDCTAQHGKPHPVTGSKVILTTAHLDHDTDNNRLSNLRAWCNRCHLTYDTEHHAANAAATRRRKRIEAGQLEIEF